MIAGYFSENEIKCSKYLRLMYLKGSNFMLLQFQVKIVKLLDIMNFRNFITHERVFFSTKRKLAWYPPTIRNQCSRNSELVGNISQLVRCKHYFELYCEVLVNLSSTLEVFLSVFLVNRKVHRSLRKPRF